MFPSSGRRYHENICLVDTDADEEAFNSSFYATNDFFYRKLPLSRPISPNMRDVFHETLAVRFVDASNFKTLPRFLELREAKDSSRHQMLPNPTS
jgi:hypothetical protein